MKKILFVLALFFSVSCYSQTAKPLEFSVELTDSIYFHPSKLFVDKWELADPVQGVEMVKVYTRLIEEKANEITVRRSWDLLPKADFEKVIASRNKITGEIEVNKVELNKILALFKLKLKL